MMPGGDPAKSPAKYIYVARNPKDVAVSLFYHARRCVCFEFTGDWDCFFEYFISGKAENGSWFDHVLGWWEHRGLLIIAPYTVVLYCPHIMIRCRQHNVPQV